MKLLKNEFEVMLSHAKSLTGDARKAMIDSLRSATVVEVEAKVVETPIEIQIAELDGDAQKAIAQPQAGLTADQIAAQVKAAIDDALKSKGYIPAPIVQPQQKGFAIPAHVRRVGSLKAFSAKEINGYTPEQRAYRFYKWALACMGNEN